MCFQFDTINVLMVFRIGGFSDSQCFGCLEYVLWNV